MFWRGSHSAACLILLCTFSTTIKRCSLKVAARILPKRKLAGGGTVGEVFGYAEDRFNLPRGTDQLDPVD